MMDRRTFMGAVAAGTLASSSVVVAQASRSMPLVGFLGPPSYAGGFLHAFQQGLLELGYVEGRNLRVEYRYNVAIDGNLDSLAQLASELVSLKPDVLVVSLTEVALAARRATSTIPIVMANVADPVAAGLVASLGRPGGNVTGLSRQTPELIGKQLQLLKETVPAMTRVGALLNPADRLHAVNERIVKETADSLGVKVEILTPATTAELESAFATLRSSRANSVLVGDGGVFYLSRAQICNLALRDRLPAMCSHREFVQAGALMSFAPNNVANYHRAAYFVDKILKGAKPGDLPVEQPTKFELVISQATAKVLAIAIPQSILLRADEVVQS